jgi:hypothetical protein
MVMPDHGCADIRALTSVKHSKRRDCDDCVKTGARRVHAARSTGMWFDTFQMTIEDTDERLHALNDACRRVSSSRHFSIASRT